MNDRLLNQLKLCLVTHIQTDLMGYTKFIEKAIGGGVTMVQLREKGQAIDEVKEKALFIKKILKPLAIPLIINDHVELAAKIGADGVHLGQQDMPVARARTILGDDKIIGLSIESFAQLDKANQDANINYVTASAVFPSLTKPDCQTIWGVEGLAKLVAKSVHPMTAIGGINISNAAQVFRVGVAGIAVVAAIHDALDPCQAAKALQGLANHYSYSNKTK